MLENVIAELTRKQRPYYLPQGSPTKGIDNQYWLIFKHRDADNLLKNIVSFLGLGSKQATHKLLRIDPYSAKVYTYTPLNQGDVPSTALLRSGKLAIIEKFLKQESATREPALLEGSLRAIKGLKRRYNLPEELEKYNKGIAQMLERSVIYRRSTAYFDSGVLKLYEEPLQNIVQTDGQIRLLMDWQGFTKRADINELEKLHDPNYRDRFAKRTLQEFLQGLEDSAFSGTEILAELVRLGFLQIKLIEMEQGRAIYHKKTGIFSDSLDNHTLHEGSDNFTRAAHSRNAESVTFLYSWESLDREAILQSIQQFDSEWQRQDITHDLSQEFLEQVRQERDRRAQQKQPSIETITPDEFPPGEITEVEIEGQNLDRIDKIEVTNDDLVKINITEQTPDKINAQVEVSPEHPPQPLNDLRVRDRSGTEYITKPPINPQIGKGLEVPDYPEIEGFKQAVESILAGQQGKPEDFLYWMAQQRPRQFRVESSDLLDELVNQDILFEHQKSGAQHCLRVMQDFGVAVCADAVGLGKTRLAAAVTRLYRSSNPNARIAVIAAKKLFPNWEREMSELGFAKHEYELYNKNLMSRKGTGFLDDFNRYGGPDLVIIDEAHEGIRNYNNRIHKTCLQIRDRDRENSRQRYFLLLTATPWNNRREDIYNILRPFLSRLEGFTERDFPHEVPLWFENREAGLENFTDRTDLFRRTYRELFLQRTRQMLRDAMPDLNVYAKRQAEWLPVKFEDSTEKALEQIFTQFETSLYIPFADPIRYLTGNAEQRSLLRNQRRFFLQRAESSMYALRRTIVNFRGRIEQMQSRLEAVSSDADGLKEFLLEHYNFRSEQQDSQNNPNNFDYLDDPEAWDEDYEEEEEDEAETEAEQQQKRQQLRRSIDLATDALRDDSTKASQVYNLILDACTKDLKQLEQIQHLLADEFVKDHKRLSVTQQVRQLVTQGHKVLLISTFSDTVLDYYLHMTKDEEIANKGIGMAIGSTKRYYPDCSPTSQQFSPHNALKGKIRKTGLQRQELFRLFAPDATCRSFAERPKPDEEISVLIGSETLSVGQNLQDADYLINIDLPWNPMTLEQRIGRIDRPKQHQADNIFIYYANSESQLLRQASRLANLNKKLVGDHAQTNSESIQSIVSVETLGASIYGDTLFDDTILPGYVEFIQSLVKVRRTEQGNFQEDAFSKQETARDLYTHQEILHSEDLSRLVERLGEAYQAKAIALGRKIGDADEPTGLVALTIRYYDPNGEEIPEQQRDIFWNDRTGERDGYGVAIAAAFKTPEAGDVFSAKYLFTCANGLYSNLVELKQQQNTNLDLADTLENITVTSERLNKIQTRIGTLASFPEGLTRTVVKETLKKLNSCKHMKPVQKLLRDYTDGAAAKLDSPDFIVQLVDDTDELSLLAFDSVKATSLRISLSALLLRA